jgi:hypothetical protein
VSQSEILNYDPSRLSPTENRVELQEITFYDRNRVPIWSMYVPVSALANKTDGEVRRYLLRVLRAYTAIDVSHMELNNDIAEEMSEAITNTYAHYYARCMMANLMAIYGERLKRRDGTDPEIKIDNETENDNQCQETVKLEQAALDRIIDHLFSKLKTRTANHLVKRRDIITEFWRLVLCNVAGKAILLIEEKRGNPFNLPKEEFLSELESIGKEIWWRTFYLTFESAGQRIASKVLPRLNPAGVAFEELKEMVRGGLDAWPMFQDDDLRQLAKGMKRIIHEPGVQVRLGGDGRILSIELPKESKLSNSDRLVDQQDALIKYLLEPPKLGRRPDPNKIIKLREYAKFAELTHKRKEIAEYLNEFAKEHSTDEWFKMLEFADRFKYLCDQYESRGYDRTLITEAAKAVYDYHSNTDLMIKDKTKWDRAVSPLGIAQILASLEMGWRDDKGAPLDSTILRDRYNEVACDWKMRDGIEE